MKKGSGKEIPACMLTSLVRGLVLPSMQTVSSCMKLIQKMRWCGRAPRFILPWIIVDQWSVSPQISPMTLFSPQCLPHPNSYMCLIVQLNWDVHYSTVTWNWFSGFNPLPSYSCTVAMHHYIIHSNLLYCDRPAFGWYKTEAEMRSGNSRLLAHPVVWLMNVSLDLSNDVHWCRVTI